MGIIIRLDEESSMRRKKKQFFKKRLKKARAHKRNRSDLGYLSIQKSSLTKNKQRPNMRKIMKNPFCSDLEISKMSRSKQIEKSRDEEEYNQMVLMGGALSPDKRSGAFSKMKEFQGLSKSNSLKVGMGNTVFDFPGSGFAEGKRKFSINAIAKKLDEISESPLEKDMMSRNYNSTKKKVKNK